MEREKGRVKRRDRGGWKEKEVWKKKIKDREGGMKEERGTQEDGTRGKKERTKGRRRGRGKTKLREDRGKGDRGKEGKEDGNKGRRTLCSPSVLGSALFIVFCMFKHIKIFKTELLLVFFFLIVDCQ